MSLNQKVEMTLEQFRKKTSPLEKYIYLHTIQDADETLFFAVLVKYTEEVMPYVYTPTVGEACLQWSNIYRHTPRGLYLSIKDRGNIRQILDNWPQDDIRIIVVTDGERILGLGDLGCNGMGIPIGKLALYTTCAGIDPSKCLPIHIDVGTNREELLNDSRYMGLKHTRITGVKYQELLKEFMDACVDKYGRNVLIQFEDFGNKNAFHLLEQYKNSHCCFNDDIQGTASVVVAGIIASLPLCNKTQIADHKFLFYGAGEAGVGIANMIAMAIQKELNCTIERAREQIWLVDSQGLICFNRHNNIANHKLPFAHSISSDGDTCPIDLLECIEMIQPSALIGVSAQPQSFTEEICKKMAMIQKNPLIFALSNPTSKAECTAQQAYEWTNGQCIFASGSPFDSVTLLDKRTFLPGQGNNAYIFPGIGLGAIASNATTITDEDFLIAAETLAQQVNQDRLDQGCIYPSLNNIRRVSVKIASAVATNVYKSGRSNSNSIPTNIEMHCQSFMYYPEYINQAE